MIGTRKNKKARLSNSKIRFKKRAGVKCYRVLCDTEFEAVLPYLTTDTYAYNKKDLAKKRKEVQSNLHIACTLVSKDLKQ